MKAERRKLEKLSRKNQCGEIIPAEYDKEDKRANERSA